MIGMLVALMVSQPPSGSPVIATPDRSTSAASSQRHSPASRALTTIQGDELRALVIGNAFHQQGAIATFKFFDRSVLVVLPEIATSMHFQIADRMVILLDLNGTAGRIIFSRDDDGHIFTQVLGMGFKDESFVVTSVKKSER